MPFFDCPATLDLPRQGIVALPDAHDIDIECRAGALWITVDHDLRDVVLAPGDHFRSPTHRRVTISALQPSRVGFSGPSPTAARPAPTGRPVARDARLTGMSPA
ncbi:MAG: DUF2917 domain-containing protein [Gammaproteobacteria bacterium]|nr:DUF2917 domain-containing protein [Gammaproteobacteria bacterium]